MATSKRKGDKVARTESRYAQITVYPGDAAELRKFAAVASGQLGVKVTLSDALRMACRIASAHLDEAPTAFFPKEGN